MVMEVSWNTVALIAGLMSYGLLAAMATWKSLKAAWVQIRALPRLMQTLLAAMAIIATVGAQKSGRGPAPGAGLRTLEEGLSNQESTVTAEEIAQGFRLASVTNDTGHSFSMPSNAVYIGRLHIHGARSDFGRNVVDLGTVGGEPTDWAFPFGPGDATASAFWWFMDGRLQDAPRTPSFTASAELGDVLAVQGESRLWMLAECEARTVTWESFFAGGDTNAPTSAQIVLYRNGDFTVRSNDFLRVYRRVDPHDWDGDGLDNLIDARPVSSDGDCFGTGVEWLNANCGGVLSAVQANDGHAIVWSTNANEAAYYWLSFTPTHDRTRIAIVCDGASNLGNMVVMANEGQVCEAPLLMGASYRVTANGPVDNISASDSAAVVRLNSALPPGAGGGETCGPSDDFEVERPISLGIEAGDGGGRIASDPDIGVVFGSVTGNCCSVECNASNYVWGCSGGCGCSGYSQWWRVTALWEGYTKDFDWMAQCSCQRANEANPAAWVSLSCPPAVMRGGNAHVVSGVFNPPGSFQGDATMSLQCTAGAGKISVLSSGVGWMEIQGAATSESVGDVEFTLVSEIGGQSYTNVARLTVACVANLDMTCAYAGTSPNPPPFDGEAECPFSVTNSLAPDRHLVVPFYRVATLGGSGFSVADFDVDMNLVLSPSGVDAASLPVEWQLIEALPQMSGSLVPHGLSAAFRNPRQGGVYRFRGRVDGCPWTEGNVVLPLSGASINAVFSSDFAVYVSAMADLSAISGPLERQTPSFGLRWFSNAGASDYRGRVDNATWQTVWRYNQVNDADGFGAVTTLYGVPVRTAKLGNFLAGFGTRMLGVWGVSRWLAQSIGTGNDETAEMSWDAGTDVADGSSFSSRVAALSANMWGVSDTKVRTLWPNPAAADNHVEPPLDHIDYNFFFRSPGVVEWSVGP